MKQIDHSLIISLLTSTDVGKTHVEFYLRSFSVPWNIAILQRLSLAGTDAPCISTELVNQGGLDPEQLGFLRFSHKLIEHFGYVQVPNSAPVGPVRVAKTCKRYHNITWWVLLHCSSRGMFEYDPVDFHWNSFEKTAWTKYLDAAVYDVLKSLLQNSKLLASTSQELDRPSWAHIFFTNWACQYESDAQVQSLLLGGMNNPR